MKTIIKIFGCLFLLQLTSLLYAQQENGRIIFRPYPIENKLIYIKIQDSVYTSPLVNLPSGKHEVSLWSPHKIPLDTVVQVLADSTTNFKIFMASTSNYLQYKKSLKQYNKKVRLPKILALTISTGLTISSLLAYRNAQSEWERLENSYQAYQFSSPIDLASNERSLIQVEEDYLIKKKKFRNMLIITGVSLGLTTWIFYKLKNKKKPILIPEEPPFQISYAPILGINNTNEHYLKFTFIKSLSK